MEILNLKSSLLLPLQFQAAPEPGTGVIHLHGHSFAELQPESPLIDGSLDVGNKAAILHKGACRPEQKPPVTVTGTAEACGSSRNLLFELCMSKFLKLDLSRNKNKLD